ncbi:MAG: hypothetical protein NTX50_01865 [Candidatus Sumerlaeota bacterium]|nr:hypothetical protein [Candidatus Sumerlaeota bacterium]
MTEKCRGFFHAFHSSLRIQPSRLIEPGILSLAILAACVIGTALVGGPQTWDELQYMNLGLVPDKLNYIVCRYFHIYLQKFFMWLMQDPLTGAKLFWSFELSVTAAMVYLCAARLARHSRRMTGILAALLYLTQRVLFALPGVTYSDFTVMMMMTAALLFYVIAMQSEGRKRAIFLALLGLACYCGFRSKEVAVAAGILGFGMGWRGDSWDARRWLREVAWTGAGMMGGAFIFVFLDMMILGDPFFSLSIRRMFDSVEYQALMGTGPRFSWLSPAIQLFMPCLLLYFISLRIQALHSMTPAERVAWLYPIFFLLTLTGISLKQAIFWDERKFYPLIPLLCVWAAQPFGLPMRLRPLRFFERPAAKFAVLLLLAGAAVATGEALVSALYLPARWGWKVDNYNDAFLRVTALLCLSALLSLIPKWNHWTLYVAGTLLWAVSSQTFHENFNYLTDGKAADRSNLRFATLHNFRNELPFSDDCNYFVSTNVMPPPTYPGEYTSPYTRDRPRYMINILFNKHIPKDSLFTSDDMSDFFKSDCDYALLRRKDWFALEPLLKAADRKIYVSHTIANGDGSYMLLARHPFAKLAGWPLLEEGNYIEKIKATTGVLQMAELIWDYSIYVNKTPVINEAFSSKSAQLLETTKPVRRINENTAFLGMHFWRMDPSMCQILMAFSLKRPLSKNARLTVIGYVKYEDISSLLPEWRPHKRAILYEGIVNTALWKPGKINPVHIYFLSKDIPYNILFSFYEPTEFPQEQYINCGWWPPSAAPSQTSP